MAKRSTNWIGEMAEAMRACGALHASRKTIGRSGNPEEYTLVLADHVPHVQATQQQQTVPVQALTESELREHHIKQQYFDLFGRYPSKEEMVVYKDMPTLLG